MVACGVMTPERMYRTVDCDALVLLLGMMQITVYRLLAGLLSPESEGILAQHG